MTGKRIKIFLVVVLFAQLSAAVSISENRVSGIKKTDGRKIIAAKTDLFNAAKKILVLQGFRIRKLDEEAGTLSTSPVPMRVNVSDCECELTMGPLKDTRPIITVSVDVKVEENRISIGSSIIGDYPREQISEEIIEDDLFNRILQYLK